MIVDEKDVPQELRKFLVNVQMEITAKDLDTATEYADQVLYVGSHTADDSVYGYGDPSRDYDGSNVTEYDVDFRSAREIA